VTYLFLASFVAGLLLGVRLMFYGAERRRKPTVGTLPLRRWEPAGVGFLVMFGVVGYLLTRDGGESASTALLVAAPAGLSFAAVVTWLAILTARVQPEHNPDDPRYLLQGRVGVVTVTIPVGGEGMIRYEESGSAPVVAARNIDGSAIDAGEEVCIERVEDGVAHVELWRLVEQRL
jgi:membrane protein implicated in regulation of membrane protease activity